MTPLEARCTNYEEGIHDVVEGLKSGSMPLEEAVNLLQGLLDAPADVSLWRSHDGRLGYWMLRLQTNLLSIPH